MVDLVSTNPARGYQEIGRVPISTSQEIAAAVQKAQAAFPGWRARSLSERLEFFKRLKPLVENHAEDLARLESQEMGKPLRESRKSVNGNIRRIEWHIEHAPALLEVRFIGATESGETGVSREPWGVVGAIMPWNFPTSNFFIPALPALISGNTLILKHSEECPLVSKMIADLVKEAEFPDGVCSILYGAGDVGAQVLAQDIDFVYFTGSTHTGRAIYEQSAKKFVPAILEMGGSSPGIMFDDADIDASVKLAYSARFWNCGQACTALKRLLVGENIYNRVLKDLKKLAAEEKIGDPLDSDTTMGPLVAARQLERLEEQVADAVHKGAKIICGGKRSEGLSGAFYAPTLLENVTNDMKVMREETFGPVLPVVPFSSEEEAIRIANDTEYGLSAFIYTSDMERANRVAGALEVGEVHINGAAKDARAPIGGYKHSGMGRADGEYGYHAMTQLKVVARPQEL